MSKKLLTRLLFGHGTLAKDHLNIYVRVYFWALHSVPLAHVSVFMPDIL